MTIVVTGATGNIGHVLTQKLVDAGRDVAVVARHPDTLPAQVLASVHPRAGDVTDPVFIQSATREAEALFWLTPPNLSIPDPIAYYRQVGEIAARAIRENGIPRVVLISSVGAQHPDAGQITGVGLQERLLGEAAPNFVALRCGFFMENFLAQLDAIRQQGSFFSVLDPDIAIPIIATRDIAERAAQLLIDREWTGQRTLGLHGPADLTLPQAAEILSEATGKPIRYVPVTEEQMAGALTAQGAAEGSARALARMQAAMNTPGFVAEPRTPATTTPTTLAQWAEEVLKPALA